MTSIPYPLEVPDPQGRPMTWTPYQVQFTSPEGTFSCHIYAISDLHAQLQLDALKETGRIDGRVCDVISEEDR